MMKLLTIIILGILLTLPLRAQDESVHIYPDSPSVIARISMIIPKVALEFAPVDQFTFSTGFWFWPQFWPGDSDQDDDQFRPYLNMRLTLEPRYFFSLDHRASQGKRIDYYSGWYIGLPFALNLNDLDFSMGTTMGFQSTFGRRWYFNVSLGPGFKYMDTRFKMTGMVNTEFGVILN